MNAPKIGTIDEVRVQPLHLVRNERGHLLEIARAEDEWFPTFGQVYATATMPGVIKGWYRHSLQQDTLTVVSGGIKLALFDDREDSKSRGRTQLEHLTTDEPRLVVIPALVWHCFESTGDSPALIVHMNSVAFHLDSPDEERRPLDHPAMPMVWEPRL